MGSALALDKEATISWQLDIDVDINTEQRSVILSSLDAFMNRARVIAGLGMESRLLDLRQ